MNLEISKYLNQYIQKKYPQYYKALSKKDFMIFVNTIASNPLFNKFSVEEISSGSKDIIIDELIDKYAQSKINDVWQENVCQHLKVDIQERFPMYCKFMTEDELNSLIATIVKNPGFVVKKYGLPEVLAGKTNEIVDEFVENYAQSRLTDVWANFGNLCNYIKNVIVNSGNHVVDLSSNKYINDLTLDSIVKQIAEGFIKNNENYTNYMNRSYDQIFLLTFDPFFDETKRECREYIKSISKKSKIKFDNVETYEYLLEQAMNSTLSKYNISDVILGKYDEEILKEYDETLSKKVTDYIHLFIVKYEVMSDLFKVKEEDVKSYFTDEKRLEESFLKMRDGKLDKDIDDFIKTEKSKLSVKQETVKEMPLLSKDNVTRREKSVRSNKSNAKNKMKHNTRTRRMDSKIFALLLAGTITASAVATGAIVNAVVNEASDVVVDVKYNYASKELRKLDIVDSSPIYTIHSDNFDEAVDNVIKFYKLCKDNGVDDSRYFSLGFRLVRDQVSGRRILAVMDNLLRQVKLQVNQMDNARDFREAIDDSCFLEFALEELYSMGCEEASDDKYNALIAAYKNAAKEARVENDEVPWDYLDEENRTLAYELIDLYKEYTKEYVIEVVEILKSTSDLNDEQVAVLLTTKKNGGR